jgi:hypothetical protein
MDMTVSSLPLLVEGRVVSDARVAQIRRIVVSDQGRYPRQTREETALPLALLACESALHLDKAQQSTRDTPSRAFCAVVAPHHRHSPTMTTKSANRE